MIDVIQIFPSCFHTIVRSCSLFSFLIEMRKGISHKRTVMTRDNGVVNSGCMGSIMHTNGFAHYLSIVSSAVIQCWDNLRDANHHLIFRQQLQIAQPLSEGQRYSEQVLVLWGLGQSLNKQKNHSFRESGMDGFSHMARHRHCLRLLGWTWTPLTIKHFFLAASNASLYPNAQNLRFRHLRLRRFLMLVGAAPQAPVNAVLSSAAARFCNRFLLKSGTQKYRTYFRIRYWHLRFHLLYSRYTNIFSKTVRTNNFIWW